MKPSIALGNLAIAGFLALLATHQDYLNKGLMVSMGKVAAVGVGGLAIAAIHEKHKLTAKDYVDGIKSVPSDIYEMLYDAGVVDLVQDSVQKIVVSTFESVPRLNNDPSFAPLEDLPFQSYVVYAGKGKGKSQLFVYLVRKFVQMGAEVKLNDTHLPKTLVDYGEYLPGIPQEKYVTDRVEDAYLLYQWAEKQLDQRRHDWKTQEDQKSGQPLVIGVEEYNSLASGLDEKAFKDIGRIIGRIENEGRWYKIYNLLTTKSLKLKNTEIDSTVFSQMDWLVLQGGFDDPNTRFLEGFDRKAVSQRQKDLGGFAVAHYDANTSDVRVFTLPDNATFGEYLKAQSQRLSFQEGDTVQLYLDSHREVILTQLRSNPNAAPSAIAEALPGFGRRSDSNPKWKALKVFLDDLRAIANQEIDQVNPFKFEDVAA